MIINFLFKLGFSKNVIIRLLNFLVWFSFLMVKKYDWGERLSFVSMFDGFLFSL